MDKLKRAKLRAQGYPVKITTHSGQFFWRYAGWIQRDETLAKAIESVINRVEYVNSGSLGQ